MKKLMTIGSIILLSLMIFQGCAKKNEEGVFKIGAILPLTGSSADAANQIKRGIELAKDNFLLENPNLNINIVYGDSKNSAKDGLIIFNKMKNIDKIKYYLAMNSGVVVPLVQTMKNYNDVVLMSTVNSAAGVPQTSDNIFRIFVSVENEVKTMAKFLIENRGLNKISVLYINDDFGLSGFNVFKRELESFSEKIYWSSSFEKNGKDFSNIVHKIPNKSEVVYVIGYDSAFGLIIRQLREHGYKNNIVTTIGLSVPPWRAIAGDAADGAFYTAADFSTTYPTEYNQKFIDNYNDKYGISPTSFTAFGYDAAYILLSGMKKGDLQVDETINAIKNIDYIGTMGNIKFDEFGEADLPLNIYQYKNKKEIKIQ